MRKKSFGKLRITFSPSCHHIHPFCENHFSWPKWKMVPSLTPRFSIKNFTVKNKMSIKQKSRYLIGHNSIFLDGNHLLWNWTLEHWSNSRKCGTSYFLVLPGLSCLQDSTRPPVSYSIYFPSKLSRALKFKPLSCWSLLENYYRKNSVLFILL